MPRVFVAYALPPEAPVLGLQMAWHLRRVMSELHTVYPPRIQPSDLHERMQASEVFHVEEVCWDADELAGWVDRCDLLLLPEWEEAFLPAVRHAWETGIPLLAVDTPTTRMRLEGGALYFTGSDEPLLAAEAAADCIDALIRLGSYQGPNGPERPFPRISPRPPLPTPESIVAAEEEVPAYGYGVTMGRGASSRGRYGMYGSAGVLRRYGAAPRAPDTYGFAEPNRVIARAEVQAKQYGLADPYRLGTPRPDRPGTGETGVAPESDSGGQPHATADGGAPVVPPAGYGMSVPRSNPAYRAPGDPYGLASRPSAQESASVQKRLVTNHPVGVATGEFRLRRIWEPLSPPWAEPAAAELGIGISTCNRLLDLRRLVEELRALTRTPFHLVIADDGSADGSAAWARESGIPVVTGRNRGVSWNKNRALYWLMQRTRCNKLLLLEDDVFPTREGWEAGWLEALETFPHLNYVPEGISGRSEEVLATYDGYPAVDWASAQLLAVTRAAIRRGGYLDTRFVGYGDEHVEFTERYRRLGLYPPLGHVTLRDGSLTGHPPAVRSGERVEEIARNQALHRLLAHDDSWRPPARTWREAEVLAHEQQRAAWPFECTVPAAHERVTVLCASRTEELARRMVASFGGDPRVDFVWAWNGPGKPDLPGTVLEYRDRPFNYCEAYNRAARFATGSVFLVINDDAELTCSGLPGLLLSLYREFPDTGIAYGGLDGEWEVLDAPEAPAWEGCCWAISRRAFFEMGGLEERLEGFGGDEFVSCVRMLRLRHPGVRIAGWTYRHPGHETYRHVRDLKWNRREFAVALGWNTPDGTGDRELLASGTVIVQTILAEEPVRNPERVWPPIGPVQEALHAGVPIRSAHPAHDTVPAQERWNEPQSAELGIGIITYNRLPQLRRLVEALRSLTRAPFHLVIADDGSTDGTAAWARARGIPVVTGENRGVAWNKNRALHWLMHRTASEKLLLLEDDTYPLREGWEEGWLAALARFPHLCYSPEGAFHGREEKVAEYHGYPALNWVGGVAVAFQRRGVEQVGYFDTRFRGYGGEHRELTDRYRRAGLHPPEGYLTLRDASLAPHPQPSATAARDEDIERNTALREQLQDEPIWRPAARDAHEATVLRTEQAAAAAATTDGQSSDVPGAMGQEQRHSDPLVPPGAW